VAADSLGRVDTNTVAVHLPASVAFGYDLNGNLRTNGARVLEYDDENQLTRVTEPGQWKSEFVYDGRMRRRVSKEFKWQTSAWVQTAEVRYLYDGNLVIQERNGLNLPQATYTRGIDLSGSLQGAGGIGGLLARTDNQLMVMGDLAAHAYYHADGNGNVTMLVDGRQMPAARYLYDPFGNTLTASGPLAEANLYRFSSKEAHAASGLVYYGYRFYDPALQRWVNRDPIAESGGLNLYTFVRNDPNRFVDLNGNEPVTVGIVTTVICSAIYGVARFGIGISAYQTQSDSEKAYRDELKRLERRYGVCLPDNIQEYMDQWRNELLCGFGAGIAPFVEGVPGISSTGPVSFPKASPPYIVLPKPPSKCLPKSPCPPTSPSFPTQEQNMGIDQVDPFGL